VFSFGEEKPMKTFRAALSCMIFLGLAACAGAPAPAERQAKADGSASKAGFTGETIRTTRFDLHTRLRGTASGGLLTIYTKVTALPGNAATGAPPIRRRSTLSPWKWRQRTPPPPISPAPR